MKRTILPLLSVALLLLAGSVMAQTGYGGTDQPANDSAATLPAGSTDQQGSTGSSAVPAAPPQDPATGSTYGESGAAALPGDASDKPATTGSQAHGRLPRTASELPLVFALGVMGAGALVALRASRIRDAH
jgi:hypothetical protein